jgi:hypothetical protein
MSFSDFFELEVPTFESEKKKFIEHMEFLRSMTNEEHTLYKKWIEVQDFFKQITKADRVKSNIWQPSNLEDEDLTIKEIQKLRPKIVFVQPDNNQEMENWLLLRTFIHTLEFERNPGRFLRFFVIDENTGKYLGCSSLGSDVILVKCRDEWIGWSTEDKIKDKKLNHSAIATTIVATQPFGYNFLGGKLVASMMTTEPVRQAWNTLYPERLVGITTTSLYGVHSMYQRIPFWKELGETTGRVVLKPDDSFYEYWHHYIKEKFSEKYEEKTYKDTGQPTTGVKQKILVMIMKELGMKQSNYMHGFTRGVFYTELYENTRQFLRNEISVDDLVINKKIKNDVDDVLRWWVPKAITRYKNLKSQNRLSTNTLFYTPMIGMSWEDAKKKYLSDVGR